LGQIFYHLGIFAYLFNEKYESKLNQSISSIHTAISLATIRAEENKNKEVEFLMQVWINLNPEDTEVVDSSFVLEFLKLVFDPYSRRVTQQSDLVQSYFDTLK